MKPRAIAASLLLLAAAACDGSSTPNNGDGGLVRPEAGSGVDTRGMTGPGGPRDVGTFEALPPKPLPTINTAAKRIMGGRARLVGTHGTACSNQPMSTERWCAFSFPGAELGTTDLWVVNMAKGGDVKCDKDMPNNADCKLLKKKLWTGQPASGPIHPTAHRFDGDTLIFHAEPTSDADIYAGKIWAWRPGWPEARAITGNQGVTCSAHPRMEVATCIENLSPATVMPLQFDLTAGKFSELPMKKIARITPTRPNTQSSQYRYGFTRNADWFFWSTGGKAVTERETLYALKTDDIAAHAMEGETSSKRVTVATNVSRWTLSNDAMKFLWLKNYNYDTEGNPSGIFEMADYPTGANPVMLGTEVGWFTTLWDGTDTDKGYLFMDKFQASKGALKAIRDRAMPASVTTLLPSTAGATFSRDLRWLLFSRNFDPDDETIDLHIARMDDPAKTCALTTSVRADLYGAPFLPNGNLVFWVDNIQLDIGVGEAFVANPDGCTGKMSFARGMDFWFLSNNNAMVYSDEGDGDTATLKYRLINNGSALGPEVRVQDGVERVYAILPNFESALFQIAPDERSDAVQAEKVSGVWYYKLPAFGGGTTPDGGAPAVDAGGGQ